MVAHRPPALLAGLVPQPSCPLWHAVAERSGREAQALNRTWLADWCNLAAAEAPEQLVLAPLPLLLMMLQAAQSMSGQCWVAELRAQTTPGLQER